MEVNDPIDLGQLRAEVEEAGAPWEVSFTSMTALEEEARVIRLGVPPSPGVDIETLEEGKEAAAAAAFQATAESIGAPVSFDLRNVGGSTTALRSRTRVAVVRALPSASSPRWRG